MRKEQIYKNYPFAELKSSDGSARIRIYVYGYQFPEIKESHDADWYMNYISLNINGVSAEIDEPIIEGRILQSLLEETINFKNLKLHEVDFSFTETEFSFTLLNESLSDKDILVSGEMIDSSLDKSNVTINFELKTDINLIETFISGIKQILIRFPSRY